MTSAVQTASERLEGMTQAKWDSLLPWQKDSLRDFSGLTEQLKGLEGKRVEVVTDYGETRRFYVGRSTGWRPCHIEVKLINSSGGMAAHSHYKSVRVIPGRSRY